MDISKLPRLSNTQVSNSQATPPPSEVVPPTSASPSTVQHVVAPAMNMHAEAWIGLAMGIIILLMQPHFLQWASSRVFHTHFNEYSLDDGTTLIPYQQVHDFWPDLGCTLFGITLIAEGLILGFARRRALLWFAFLFTLATTGYNLIYLISSYSQYGLAIISALAVAMGIYMAAVHWQLLRMKSR